MQGSWEIKVKMRSAAFEQRFKIKGSDNADGIYEGEVSTPPVQVTGAQWTISIEHKPSEPGASWIPSDERITTPKISQGKKVFDIESNDTGPDEDYNDLVLTCSALDVDSNSVIGVIEKERLEFKNLILGNPNYFGNMPDLGFDPVKIMSVNTSYEELTCIGLNPEADQLESVVNLKRHYGYQTDPCGDGSPEYVRFFVERAGVWHDVGVVSFTSYNITGSALPLSYSVGIELDEVRQFCTVENLVNVRAILSWKQEPPAGEPHWTPTWGNVLDATVQIARLTVDIAPIRVWIDKELLVLHNDLVAHVDLNQVLQPAEPKVLGYAQLKELYAGTDVPGHRFGFKEAITLRRRPIISDIFAPKETVGGSAAESTVPTLIEPPSYALYAGPELGKILEYLDLTIGDTTYEELTCVGYNPHTRMLGGVIAIKLPYGYGGDLCKPGTTEHVAFWLYFDGGWHSLGNTQVQVHDLASVSGGNTVYYAVFRGVNVPEYLCADVTGLKLRAILSWEYPPTDPDFVPTWGNVLDTYIQPPKGEPVVGDEHQVRLMRINSVQIGHISDTTGLADNSPPIIKVSGDCDAKDSPFGGNIYIEGDITNKVDVFDPDTGDVLSGTHPLLYQVFVNKVGSTATQLTNKFTIGVYPENFSGVTEVKTQEVHPIGGAEYYIYMEGTIQAVNPRTLAVWQAGGLEEGEYEIEVRAFAWNPGTSSYEQKDSQSKKVYIYNGYEHTELRSDGTTFTAYRPELLLSIDPPHDECGDVEVGQTVTGTYTVRDRFFKNFSIHLVPIMIGGALATLNPVTVSTPKAYDAVSTYGTSGTWTLETKGMEPCGYTVEFEAWDRALVGPHCHHHYNRIAVGFCLREPDA